MGVKESQPFIGHLLKVGRIDLAIWIRGRDISDPQVVRHHQNHVRLGGMQMVRAARRQEDRSETEDQQ